MTCNLDIHDYFFGVIIATPEYLKSSKRVRLLDGVDYDPFSEVPSAEALIFGIVTLLKKETRDGYDYYIDQYNSRYKNELVYQLNEENRLGIVLAYVKPFSEYYTDDPVWYCDEDIQKRDLLPQIYEDHTYYINYSKIQKDEVIVTLRDYEDSVQFDYLKDLLGEELFSSIVCHKAKEYVKE